MHLRPIFTDDAPGLSVTNCQKGGVALIGNFLSASGGSRCVCEELSLRLAATGWNVITASDKRPRPWRLLHMVHTVFWHTRDYDVAVVELYSGRAFIWAEIVCAALRTIRKPYLLALHGGHLPRFSRAHPRRVSRLLNSAAIVTVPSNYLLAEMKPFCPHLVLLPNALDLSRYEFCLRQHPQPWLLWLRSFHHIYNPLLGLQVLANLIPDFPNARLTMVGPDKGDGALQQTVRLAQRLKLLNHLCLPGGVPKTEVPTWLARGDIFLNTTNADNAPVSVLEAMACGLPVVSTNVGGLPYLLEHERDALLVPPKDGIAMTAAVRRLLTDTPLAVRLSRESRAKAETFDWSKILPLWESLLASPSPRPTGRRWPMAG
jgi:glycosyltransferase involved in cell wall biosynthesis